jgi:hypothetical protein
VKQVGPIRMSGQRPTLVDCLCELKALIILIIRDHGDNCVGAAQAWLPANHVDNMETKPDAIKAMMRLSAAKNRAKTVQDRSNADNQVALQSEKENDAAQKEVQELQRVMEPKRARTNATTANDHEECDEQSSDEMDIADYRRETARIQKQSSVALGSREDVPTPQKGKAGPLEHPRLGLVGWIVKVTVWKEEQFTVLSGQGIKHKKSTGEEGSRVGCQGEARCVELLDHHDRGINREI